MKKTLLLLVAVVLAGGGWWVWQSRSLSEGSAQQESQTPAYALPEIGISVGTTLGYACQKRQTHIDRPNWIQLTCYSAGRSSNDPDMALNNIPAFEGEQWTASRSQDLQIDGRQVTEGVFNSNSREIYYGFVRYSYTGPTNEQSFEMILPFGTGKPHASEQAALTAGRAIAQTITFD
jgi:hypothetical protein